MDIHFHHAATLSQHSCSGSCPICEPGRSGIQCEQSCLASHFGVGCVEDCDCAAGEHACNNVDGTCDCAIGYTGPKCDRPCSNGTWGFGCSQVSENRVRHFFHPVSAPASRFRNAVRVVTTESAHQSTASASVRPVSRARPVNAVVVRASGRSGFYVYV